MNTRRFAGLWLTGVIVATIATPVTAIGWLVIDELGWWGVLIYTGALAVIATTIWALMETAKNWGP